MVEQKNKIMSFKLRMSINFRGWWLWLFKGMDVVGGYDFQ